MEMKYAFCDGNFKGYCKHERNGYASNLGALNLSQKEK
jgi:hypothetical protein